MSVVERLKRERSDAQAVQTKADRESRDRSNGVWYCPACDTRCDTRVRACPRCGRSRI